LVFVPFSDTGDETAARKHFEGFYSLGPMVDHTNVHSYVEQNAVLNPIAPHGPRSYTKSFLYQISSISVDLLNYSNDRFMEYVAHLGEDYQVSAVIYEPFPSDKVNSVAVTSTACPLRNGMIHGVLNVRWKNAIHDTWVAQWVRDFIKGAKEIDERLSGKTTAHFGYANMILPGDKASEAFGENYERLREIKKKWDPEMRFNKWLAIPPAA
jgi:FAD/FMN-containing dehydrogenase